MGTLDQCVSTSIVSVMACGTLRGALAKSPCRSNRYRNGAGDGKSRAHRPVPDHGKIINAIAFAKVKEQPVRGQLLERRLLAQCCARASVFARIRGFCDRGNALSSRWFFPHVVRSGVPLHRGKLQLKLSLIVHYPKKKKKKSIIYCSFRSYIHLTCLSYDPLICNTCVFIYQTSSLSTVSLLS